MITLIPQQDILATEDFSVMVIDSDTNQPACISQVNDDISWNDVVDVINRYNCRGISIDLEDDDISLSLSETNGRLAKASFRIHGNNCSVDFSGGEKIIELEIQSDSEFNITGEDNLVCLKILSTLYPSIPTGLLAHSGIVDLSLFNYKSNDLFPLAGLSSLNKLSFHFGSLGSICGISKLKCMETLHINRVRGVIDFSSLIQMDRVRNLIVEKYRYITNWDFLGGLENLQHLHLQEADSILFTLNLKRLVFFYCGKVLDGNRSPELVIEERRKSLGVEGLPYGFRPIIEDVYNYQCDRTNTY